MNEKNVEPYTKVLNKIYDDLEINPYELCILSALIRYYNADKGYSYPSYKKLKIASKIKKDETIILYVNSLIAKGYIYKETLPGIGCHYFISKELLPTPQTEYPHKRSTSINGVTPTPQTEEHPPRKRSTTITNTITNTKTNTKTNIYSEVVDYLNKILGTDYKSSTKKTKDLIKARINEGFKLDDFKFVIDYLYKRWNNNSKMCDCLVPKTMFSNKFEGYLNNAKKINNKANENKTSSASYRKVDESKLILPGGFKKNE